MQLHFYGKIFRKISGDLVTVEAARRLEGGGVELTRR
jgi:hypothetical protein